MQVAATGERQPLVGDLAHQVVAEAEGIPAVRLEHAARRGQPPVEHRRLDRHQAGGDVEVEPGAEHGELADQPAVGRPERVEARSEQRFGGLRGARRTAGAQRRCDQLLADQRMAGGERGDALLLGLQHRTLGRPGERVDKRARRRRRERSERDVLASVRHAAAGLDDRPARGRRACGDRVKQRARRVVEPLDVVGDEQRARSQRRAEPLEHQPMQARAAQLWRDVAAHGFGGIELDEVAQWLADGQVGDRAAVDRAVEPHHAAVVPVRQLAQQARLPDPGGAGERDAAAPADGRPQQRQLRVAADQRRGRRLARVGGARRGQRLHGDRLAPAAHLQPPRRARREALRQPPGQLGRRQHRAGIGQLGQARGDVHRVAHQRDAGHAAATDIGDEGPAAVHARAGAQAGGH